MQKRNFWSWFFSSVVFWPVIIILIGLIVFLWWGKYQENKKATADLRALEEKIRKLEKENQQISSLINYFNSDFYIEKEGREKMNLKKEGEKVVLVLGEEIEDKPSSRDHLHSRQSNFSNLKLWWLYFFGQNK